MLTPFRLPTPLTAITVVVLAATGATAQEFGLESFPEDYEVEAVSSPSGVTHLTFSRR